ELIDAIEVAVVATLAVGAAKAIGKRHEMRALAEMSVSPAVAIGRRDRRGTQGPAVIAALEGEHQALAAPRIPHELDRVLDRWRTADIEMDSAGHAEGSFDPLRQRGRQLDLFPVEVLRSQLGETIDLPPQCGVKPGIPVTEVYGR